MKHLFLTWCVLATMTPAVYADTSQVDVLMHQGKYQDASALLISERSKATDATEIEGIDWLSARCLWELRDYSGFSAKTDEFVKIYPSSENGYWLLLWKS